MSAPQTNIEAQKRHHRWPLIGIGAALVVGALIGVLMTFDATDDEGAPVENLETSTTPPAADATAPATPPAAPEGTALPDDDAQSGNGIAPTEASPDPDPSD